MKRSLSVWILVLALGILTISSSGDCAEAVKTPKKLGPPRKAAKVAQEDSNAEEITNSIGMKLRRIEPGSFMMGKDTGAATFAEDEKPVHKVNITKPFYIGVYEVTEQEWSKVMGGVYLEPAAEKYPKVNVTWNVAQEFCRKLSQKEGYRYFLPSEAQWEYTCRAGTTGSCYYGNDGGVEGEYEWMDGEMHLVGQKKSNPWGFYDMLGNASEWCQDWYGPYSSNEVKDPIGPTSGTKKVIRASTYKMYCAGRSSLPPNVKDNDLGFRVCRSTYKVDSINTANRDAAKTGRITGAVAISYTQCPGCNKEIQSEWKFCPFCGKKLAAD